MLMAFDIDIEHVKGNNIPHVDALSRLRFITSESEKEVESFEDTFIHGVENDILSIDIFGFKFLG